jgi:predicted XRE-type DNA-binding protein
MMKNKVEDARVVKGSGNIFADLDLPNPVGDLFKADIAFQISQLIREKRLTQTKAARLLGVDQPRISDLLKGKIGRFSLEKLLDFLTALGRDVEITHRPGQEPNRRATIRVVVVNTKRGKVGV